MALEISRKQTRQILVGKIPVGGSAPISLQSMTNTATTNVEATVSQIHRLAKIGCDIIRVAVPDDASAACLPDIIKQSPMPVIADIHFQVDLAIKSILAGAHCIRINPGNLIPAQRLPDIISLAKQKNVSLRIGVNSGSLEDDLLNKYEHPTAEALAESALRWVERFERQQFYEFKISIKSSGVTETIQANRLLSFKCNYPLHIGITESGPVSIGSIRSAVGIGVLLAEGIGDTIRVSLAGDPEKEIRVGKAILESLSLRKPGLEIIACPTCARAEFDVEELAESLVPLQDEINFPLKVAVMGCVVNGPGEAKEADIGIAGSKNLVLIFKDGIIIRRVSKTEAYSALRQLLFDIITERKTTT